MKTGSERPDALASSRSPAVVLAGEETGDEPLRRSAPLLVPQLFARRCARSISPRAGHVSKEGSTAAAVAQSSIRGN